MKILLLSMPIEKECRGFNPEQDPYSLGLAYLHSSLEKDGNDVKVLFLNSTDEDCAELEFKNLVKSFQPEVVGFQMFAFNRITTYRAIDWLLNEYPQIRVVIGGIHSSSMHEQLINKYPAAVIVVGEGEITLVELVRAFESGGNLSEIDGLVFCEKGKVVMTKPRVLLMSLDSLPPASHHVYFDQQPSRKMAHMITSRGCPFNCSFCCLKVISKRVYRKRSIDKVIDEIRDLKSRYPRVQTIMLHDDTFLLDNNRVIDFCKKVINENFNLRFICSARVKPVSVELFQWMEKAGFTDIGFGLETGSKKLLKSISKEITHEDVIGLFKVLRSAKTRLRVSIFLMCSFPGETMETIRETIDLVRRCQKIYYSLNSGAVTLRVYPGTQIYENMKEAGQISDDFWLSENPVPVYDIENSIEQIKEFQEAINSQLSIRKILTPSGFKNHFLMMPRDIIRYLIRNGEKQLFLDILSASFVPILKRYPAAMNYVRKLFKK